MSSPLISIAWTVAGDLRVDDVAEDQPALLVNFFEWRKKSRLEKLELALDIIQKALNTAELTEDAP